MDLELDDGTLVDGILQVEEDKVHNVVEVGEDKVHKMVEVVVGVGLEDRDQLRQPR